MSTIPHPLDSSSQTRTALATTLGLLSILAEELARTRAVDADRVIERFDRFAQSASVAAGTAPGEASRTRRHEAGNDDHIPEGR